MVRRLPWTHPHLKVGHAAESKPQPKRRKRATSTAIATATTPIRNTIDTGTRDISSYFTTTRKMGYRTPRGGGGRRLMYNSGGGGSSRSSRTTTTPYTPNRSGGRTYSPSPPPSQKKRLDGLFLEGNWYCNCQPRNTAKFLQVSKNTANRGRWFYTCEKRRGGCNFFLWAEDAENRAEGATMTLPPMPQDGAVAGNSATPRRTTGPAQGGFTPGTASTIKPSATRAASSSAMMEPPPSPTAQRSAAKQKFMDTYFKNRPVQVPEYEEPNDLMVTDEEAELTTPAQRKRKRVLFDFDSDDDGEEAQGQGQGGARTDDYGLDDDVSSDEERAMTEAMERSAKKLRAEDGGGGGGGGGAPSTPAAQRTVHDGALPTPQTVSRTLFPDAKRRKVGEDVVGEISPGNVSFSTSTSSATLGRSTAAGTGTIPPSSSPPTSTPQEEQLDPTEEVMALLQGQKGVDGATARDVRAVLGRFAMKAKGLARGRDTVRTALKAKDEKIAELQERVASLEARARTQREQIADFKAGMMDLYSKH
ncbi:uncharacterized protein BDZ83DRAFT_600178 [Colletotrichum acutatum]|uniref:GRF-type domain-containing protein n=1 Tax=Glomerella acutata TaxID=27357 RepID=A0AAD9D2K6_GLOAC|nr:uncharacterized protein BDZ83DRAFT_600178 [Colletotrichum acutatum]KAK1730676.1 hypothetical protein BDZ83DRAFT_600178 [Colletotrichum acutatum]